MLFNSFNFVFIFLPITFVLYFLLHKLKLSKWALAFLITASLVFYGIWNPIYLILIFSSMVFNFTVGYFLLKSFKGKIRGIILAFGIFGNLALLGYFKYYDFFASNINWVFETNIAMKHLLLPLAISFFTFQQIAFLVDSYRNETKKYSFVHYTLFITFFPQLVAGPIVNHQELIPQFEDKKNYFINMENIAKGIFIFSLGLAKKVAIADTFAIWANDGYANLEVLTTTEAWITSLSYTMQLYFDFSGYSDMAIGLALIFNIKLPVNFYSPYKSRNIQEFWKSWHMTLNRFLTHYLYFPLGGSRKGPVRTYINIMIIFFVSGIWHGAGWTFVIWGLLHGLASVIVKFWSKLNIKLPYVVSWFITMFFVHIAWVYFRATSVDQAHELLAKMFTLDESFRSYFTNELFAFSTWNTFEVFGEIWFTDPEFILYFLIIACIIAFLLPNSIQLLERFKPNIINLVLINIFILSTFLSVYILNKNSEFLYFNF